MDSISCDLGSHYQLLSLPLALSAFLFLSLSPPSLPLSTSLYLSLPLSNSLPLSTSLPLSLSLPLLSLSIPLSTYLYLYLPISLSLPLFPSARVPSRPYMSPAKNLRRLRKILEGIGGR